MVRCSIVPSRGTTDFIGPSQVIAGWTEGVQLMVEGEKRRLWIPERLAYGGQRGAPQGMLVFDVELIKIESYRRGSDLDFQSDRRLSKIEI